MPRYTEHKYRTAQPLTQPDKRQAKRKFARYIMYLGAGMTVREMVDVARKNGMQVIRGWKPDMHVFAEIGLYGTPQQMQATENAWITKGLRVCVSKPSAAFGVNLNLPRPQWAEAEILAEEKQPKP